MTTKIVKIDGEHINLHVIEEVATLLKQGGLVAFPTETVYGIGANALNENSIKRIYEAKGRPSDNPLIVHIAQLSDVYKYVSEVSDISLKLMNKFWPGPLTLIFNKNATLSSVITGGLETVAIRLPSNNIAKAIIKASGLPIAAPSANRSGKPSPTRAKHVIEDLDGLVDMIIDGGKAQIGLESTVLDVSSSIPVLLRPGSVTIEMLEKEIGQVLIDPTLIGEHEKITPKSPGMKYKHYAPKGMLAVVYGEDYLAIKEINQLVKEKEVAGYSVAVISTDEDKEMYQCENIMVIGSKNNGIEIAANLFKILRKMDEKGIEYIYTKAFSEENIGMATMNRLLKAAGNKKICL
ncbi:MAG: threonylcarbamoyl-AMP synthase [Firmicutes bacterium HGW-Firmicutes-7]|nr:MAG: threonylcarbamoyl-AMP synthase [Firmicutes bacterium HGW-Firmicutes-7]